MFIMASDQKSVLNSDFVERFCIVEKPDSVLIIASYSETRAVTIGKYIDRREATEALIDLLDRLPDATVFWMPDSVLFHGENRKRDARTALEKEEADIG